MTVIEAIDRTLELLELVEVRGKQNRKALDACVTILENVKDAIDETEDEDDSENE